MPVSTHLSKKNGSNHHHSNYPRTLYDKVWEDHVVTTRDDGTTLLYIDRHLLHEVTSPQAFSGLRYANRAPWRIDANLATVDHNVPTQNRQAGLAGIEDEVSRIQVQTLDDNCRQWGIAEFDLLDKRQGIVHVVGPEQGATLPGMTIVCGDSHTATHGAFAALAHGIGTSEVEHVLATQCLLQQKMANMRVIFNGNLPMGITAKDLILALIREIGTAGGTGYTIEFAGSSVRQLTMEGRMTLCNMTIEAGARAGMIAVDDATIEYCADKPMAPKGALWDQAVLAWQALVSDSESVFDKEIVVDVSELTPQMTWGTSPEMVIGCYEHIPELASAKTDSQRLSWQRAYEYMGVEPGALLSDYALDRVFLGSCTNARIEDFREAAAILRGRVIADNIKQALAVPGSGLVKQQAEAEGLDLVFKAAGFEWRDPGCSMCLAMNADRLLPGERCASTSNRNFEGRQGYGGRTHLMSPSMVAAAAVQGAVVDVRNIPAN